ncbi:hypothetical protein PHMEG_0007024 [Phytophthora megakarya]|uniref:Reverse transcriptase n=1 Tax=Phytophthora megakarya TaxID=4795 RepID=A0A225WPC5_9STRA|nr:hypothetical protein PHMEG_0007024 [Phytophthora megakarya]
MPSDKIAKAEAIVTSTIRRSALGQNEYRSLLGCLRHVATCIRPARAFLQWLREHERYLHHWKTIPATNNIREDLLWWLRVLQVGTLNGVSLEYFNDLPAVDIIVEMDASDAGQCAIVRADTLVLTYAFNTHERNLIEESKTNHDVGFDINYRELLSCAFAVHTWGFTWFRHHVTPRGPSPPLHVRFLIATRLPSAGKRRWRQRIVTPKRTWETEWNLRFFAIHIAGVENTIADAGSRSPPVSPNINSTDLETIWRSISAPTQSR